MKTNNSCRIEECINDFELNVEEFLGLCKNDNESDLDLRSIVLCKAVSSLINVCNQREFCYDKYTSEINRLWFSLNFILDLKDLDQWISIPMKDVLSSMELVIGDLLNYDCVHGSYGYNTLHERYRFLLECNKKVV